jgi:Cu(I)/Ag(I) efflux system membrane protein CusA/SilA
VITQGDHREGLIERLIDFSARNRFFTLALVGFLCVIAWQSMMTVPLDAIPDISDTQVIIYTKWIGRPPNLIEDQVTYPIVTALTAAPAVKTVRGFSDFGYSYVYVIFEDGTDIYWARSRILEYLAKLGGTLPDDAKMELGPDASAVGWVYEYALVDRTGKHDLADLRSLQDWYVRYALQSVEGVAEVAPLGGFEKQYVVEINPERLRSYGMTVDQISSRIRSSNNDVGGRVVEFSGREYMVWGRGYVKDKADIEQISLGATQGGVPIKVGDVAHVTIAPNMRRGVGELDGDGEVVGGVVLMRFGENALNVIERVKEKLDDLKKTLPEGVEIVETYDRSELIKRAIDNLKHSLTEEMIVVSIVIIVFLLHIPSAIIPILTIPIAVLLSFIPMQLAGVTSNIMSLGGIAVAIGALVDAAIVVVENSHKRIEEWQEGGRQGSFTEVLISAIKEVGRPSFFSLLILSVSFLPVFALTGQEGRLFRPLALTKTLAMALAAVLAITLDPAIRLLFIRQEPFTFRPRWLAGLCNHVIIGKVHKEEDHPISYFLFRIYEPACRLVLRIPGTAILLAVIAVIATAPVAMQLGKEFMPPLEEGSILYMPTTMPGLSVTEATRILQVQDRIIKTIPEVKTVFGKAGRFESSTDPAPFSMVETIIVLKPESEWRSKATWYSDWMPEFLRFVVRPFWPDRVTTDDILAELDEKVRFPGWQNAWTMPVRTRIDMLATGIRTPVGVKVLGADLKEIEKIALRIEEVTRSVPGTRSVFAERATGGYFLRITPRREALARYGIAVEDALMQVETSLGGMEIDRTIEGRERYTISVRYARELRNDLESIRRILVPVGERIGKVEAPVYAGMAMGSGEGGSGEAGAGMGGGASAMNGRKQIPLGELADVEMVSGPAMIRDDDGLLAAYVYIDIKDRDLGGYVEDLKEVIETHIRPDMPAGYTLAWSGQYEFQERANQRLMVLVPITIGIIFLLLYLNTQSIVKTLIVFCAVPFSAIGAFWLLWILGYNTSVAVWVGLIALLGVDAETGIFMLMYLDMAYEDAKAKGKLTSLVALKEAIVHGAVRRVRPKFMTVATTFIGLLPIMWATGVGADVMKRVAAPMVGGLATSFLMELLVYPAIYLVWRRREVRG